MNFFLECPAFLTFSSRDVQKTEQNVENEIVRLQVKKIFILAVFLVHTQKEYLFF